MSSSRIGQLQFDFDISDCYRGPQFYRGFQIGYFTDSHYLGTFIPAWRWPNGDWEEGHLIQDSIAEIIPTAKDCIDYAIVVDAMERVLGRRLTINELPKSEDIRRAPLDPATTTADVATAATGK